MNSNYKKPTTFSLVSVINLCTAMPEVCLAYERQNISHGLKNRIYTFGMGEKKYIMCAVRRRHCLSASCTEYGYIHAFILNRFKRIFICYACTINAIMIRFAHWSHLNFNEKKYCRDFIYYKNLSLI